MIQQVVVVGNAVGPDISLVFCKKKEKRRKRNGRKEKRGGCWGHFIIIFIYLILVRSGELECAFLI